MANNYKITFSQRLSDYIARVVRSWSFIIGQLTFIAIWILFNHFVKQWSFDNSNFDLLRLVLTIESSFIGSILLMHQHRQGESDRKIIYNDYLLDWQIKQEVKEIRSLINDLIKKEDQKSKNN